MSTAAVVHCCVLHCNIDPSNRPYIDSGTRLNIHRCSCCSCCSRSSDDAEDDDGYRETSHSSCNARQIRFQGSAHRSCLERIWK